VQLVDGLEDYEIYQINLWWPATRSPEGAQGGGEGGIRTPDTVARMPHFECGAFNHSATSPGQVTSKGYSYIGANGLATSVRLGPKLRPRPSRERAFCQSADHFSRRRVGR
jgi:hypothetical protein